MGKLLTIQIIQLAISLWLVPPVVNEPKTVKVANFKANASWDETKIFDGIWTAELLIDDEFHKIPPIIVEEKDER